MDGLKEGRIVAAEFGQGIDKAMQDAIKGTNISEQQLVKWGQAVASGGQGGVQAIQEMNQALSLIDDDTKRNEIGVKMYGTLWEEQGGKISQTIQGMNEHIRTAAQNTAELNSDIAALESDPAFQLAEAVGKIKESLAPVLGVIANLIAKIAEWVSNNTALFAAIVAIVAVIGTLAGAFAVLMPAIGGLVTAWPALAVAIGAISAPITLVIGAIAGLGVALVAAYQSSETFRENVNNVFQSIKDVAVTVFETVASFIGEKIAQIKQFWDENGAQILQAAENLFSGILSVIEFCMPAAQFIVESVWSAIKNVIDGSLKIITGAIQIFSGIFTGDFSKMWEGIKDIFSGAIEFVIGLMTLSFFGGIKTLLTNLAKSGVSLLKGMWDDITKTFSTMTTNSVNFVKDMASKVISYFTNLLTNAKNIFGTLKTFGETTWNALKTVVVHAAKKIWEDVAKNFTGLLTSVKTTMTTVKTTISDLWGKAVAAIKPNSLFQVGKDVVSGLIKGIGEMFGGVQKKIEALAASIPEWAKKVLGIHSPSRVMKQIGLWTGEGLVIGLDNSSATVNKAMENIGDGILSVSKSYQEEYSKLLDEHNKKNEDKNDKTLEKIYKIRNAAAKKKRALTQKELQDIALLEASYRDSKLKSEQDFDKKYKALIEKSEKEYLEVVSQYIADKKSLEELSLIDEAAIWEQSLEMFVEGSNERIKAQQNYKNAVEAVHKEITAINTDYSNQINKINDDLIKQEETLTKAYEDAVDKRAQSLVSFKNLFDEFKAEIDVTGEELLTNLGSQVEGFKRWQQEIELLSTKAIDEGLLAELREMGPNALPELIALNSLTAEQLTRYSELYKEKSSLARKQAETELIGMKNDTDKQIKGLRDVANKQLDTLEKEWTNKIKSLTKATSKEMSSLEQVGRDAGNGLLQGLSSTASAIEKKAREIANSVKRTIQDALDIHSPSRVTMGFGVNVNEGLIKGMEQSQGKLQRAMNNVYGSLASSASKSAQITSSRAMPSTSTIDNSRYMQPSITIINQVPNASPSELARKAVQAQRQLAMEWGV